MTSAPMGKQRTLDVGLGGGEPTLHSESVKLSQYAAHETRLSVSFPTHGHYKGKQSRARKP